MEYFEKLTSQGEKCREEWVRVNHGNQEKRKVWVGGGHAGTGHLQPDDEGGQGLAGGEGEVDSNLETGENNPPWVNMSV